MGKLKQMQQTIVNYHEAALRYLKNYYHSFADDNFFFGYPFIKVLVAEGKKIGAAEGLQGMDFENALMVVCFRFAGLYSFLDEADTTKYKLLQDFGSQIHYPADDIKWIETSLTRNVSNSDPYTIIEKVAWDGISYHFAIDELIVHIAFLKEELNRINHQQYSELQILSLFRERFSKSVFVTNYAKENYSERKEKNFHRLDKRLQKLQHSKNGYVKDAIKAGGNFSDRETEDLFKVAFRNYVHLVSVADSKAGLLINVNSIIISVVIAFVVSRSEKYPFLTMPSFILLSVSFVTILLSILASRPQGNHFIQDKGSGSYQTFFFGSFDLTGNEFLKADWGTYSTELDALLKGGKEKIYIEMYKEAFNVRKVLGKKFSYLSFAYWVFLVGLFISIVSFFISTYSGQ